MQVSDRVAGGREDATPVEVKPALSGAVWGGVLFLSVVCHNIWVPLLPNSHQRPARSIPDLTRWNSFPVPGAVIAPKVPG